MARRRTSVAERAVSQAGVLPTPDPESDPEGYASMQEAMERERLEREQEAQSVIDTEEERAEAAGALAGVDEREGGDFFRAIEELRASDGVVWYITRSMPVQSKGYVGCMSAQEFGLEAVRQQYGPGTYKCRPFLNGRIIKGGGNMEVAAPNSGPKVESPLDVQTLIERREQERERREEERRERSRRERNDLLALVIPAASPIVAALVGLLGKRNDMDIPALMSAMKGPSMLEVAAALKQLAPEQPREAPDMIDKAVKLLEAFGDKMGGNAGAGETGWLDVVKELAKSVGPTVGPLVEGAVQAAQARAVAAQAGGMRVLPHPSPPTPLLSNPSTAATARPSFAPQPGSNRTPMGAGASFAATAGAPALEGDDMNLMQMAKLVPFLREQCEQLVKRAAKGGNPELAAELLVEDAEADGIDIQGFAEFIRGSDWFAHLSAFDERVRNYAPWFAQARGALLEFIAEVQQEAASQTRRAQNIAATGAPVPAREVSRETDPETGNERVQLEGPGEVPSAGLIPTPEPQGR